MNLLHFKPVDRVPAVHFGYWPELLTEWAEQGKIPAELAVGNYDGSPKDMELDKLIGWDFNWFHTVGCNNGLFPAFETKVLSASTAEGLYHPTYSTRFARSTTKSERTSGRSTALT